MHASLIDQALLWSELSIGQLVQSVQYTHSENWVNYAKSGPTSQEHLVMPVDSRAVKRALSACPGVCAVTGTM